MSEFGVKRPTEREIWSLALLGFSKKGIAPENCPEMHKALTKKDLQLYRKIFGNNNKAIFEEFIETPFIKNIIWPVIA